MRIGCSIRGINEVKTIDRAIKEGFQIVIPEGNQFVEGSELVFGAGFKLLKGFYQSRYFYNIKYEGPNVVFMIDPRIADSVSNPHDDYVEVSIMIEK